MTPGRATRLLAPFVVSAAALLAGAQPAAADSASLSVTASN
jgi:hypothetical protein